MNQKVTQKTSNGQAQTFKTRIDLDQSTRQEMTSTLNQALGDLFDLYSQTKQAHWNVKGRGFYQLHELFDEIAETLLAHIDIVAERVTALGGEALGTVRMAASASRIKELPKGVFADMKIVDALAERYAQVGGSLREAIDAAEKAGDMVTSDLFIEVTHALDKSLWFLEAHLVEG